MKTSRFLSPLCCLMSLTLAVWLVLAPTGAAADQAQYIYDDLGRLAKVIDGQGNVATYNYDAVGNLLSITRNTGGVGAPTITAFTPNTGNAGASVIVSITGTNLTGASLATNNPGILVRNVLTTPTSLTATFQIAFTASAGAATVTVTTTTGSATTSFSVNASAPVVSTLSPTSGPVTRLVTITGNGFSSTAALNQIRFNGILATTLSATATLLTTQVPSGATTGPVTVTVGGLASNGMTFTVANAGSPPTLTSVFPNVGSVQGGQQTTLTGTGFIAGTTVKIGNKAASVLTLVSATSLIVQVPASIVGLADVVVTNANGDALIQNGYTYLSGAPQKIGTITPTMGLINIPRNTPVTVSFSRPVDRTSITTTTFAFTQGVTPVAGIYSFDFGDTVVTFRPAATLAASTAYTLALTQGIKSVDGVPLDGGFVGSFTTGTSSDTVSPTVTISPANGATNVPFNTTILLTFSEPINPNTVNGATVVVVSQGDIRSGTLTFGQQNTFAVFTPASPFFPTASATVTVLGQVTDMAGNALQGSGGVGTSVVSSFTTSSVADRLPPVVLQVVPFNNATGISTRTSLSATFSESVNPTTIAPTTFQVTSGGTPIAGTFAFSNLNQTVLFIPTNPFPPVATVNISISTVADVVGNVMVLPFTSSFQTQSAIDNIQPSVVRPSPSSFAFQPNPPVNTNMPLNTRPMIAFDERINPSTVTNSTFSMGILNGPGVPATSTVAADGLSATLTPNQPLLPNTFYGASWTSGIQDLVGNPLLNANSVTFTTGPVAIDLTAPTVLDASPRTGTQNLPINATVTVLFSEPVSFTSITQQTVVLSTGGVPVNTQFTLERNNTVLRIKPANLLQLQANKFYELTVTPGVLDLAGNSLGSAFGSSFTTGSATDTTGPTVTTFNPAHLSTGVSRQTTVSITFSEPVNPITVTPTTVNIGNVAGTTSLSPDLRTVTFTPTFPFFANTSISMSVTGVEDLTGNTGGGGAFFTTAVAPDTVTANLPITATGTANPDILFSDGVTSTTITVSNISGGSPLTLVPNGTVIGVMPLDSNISFTGGGTILDGVQSQADPRVRLFTTFGGNVTFTYRSPNESLPTVNGGIVNVVSVDAAGAPVAVIGNGRVTFVRGSSFLPSRNPSALLANGSSTGEMSLVVRDQYGNPIPAGQQVAVTVEPVFLSFSTASSVGGTINGGVTAPDPRFKLLTAQIGGVIEFTYTAPSQSGNQSTSGVAQVAEIDGSGNIVKQIATFNGQTDRFTLNGTTGFTGPQPVVLALSPAHTQSGVGTNATIDALFSQSLDIATVTSSTFSVNSGSAIPGTYVFLATDRGPNTLVRFTPTVPFAPSGTFTVAITVGIKNPAGIPLLGASTATFSTGTAPDTTAPTVIQVVPPSGSTNIPTNRVITVEFSEPMNATTLNATTFTVLAGGTPVSGRLAMLAGPRGPNTLATFTPNQLLSAINLYAVALTTGLRDTGGNPLGAVSSTFTTGAGVDTFRPSVVSTSPPMLDFTSVTNVPLDAKVIVQFSEPMNPLTMTSNNVQLTQVSSSGSSLVVQGTLAVSSDLRSVTFTPAQRLIPNGTHTLTLSAGLTDLAGNPLLPLPPNSVSGFITGVDATDPTPLTVVSMSPVDTDTGVPINAPVVLKFSKSVAPTTFNGATLVVTGGSGPILGTFIFEQNNQLVRWKPANLIQFAPNTVHTVSVSTGVTDLAGVPMVTSFGGSFTTGAGTDTTIPTPIGSNPVNNESGVSRVTTIAVTMSEPINPATAVLGSSGSVHLSGPGAVATGFFSPSLPGSLSVSLDRRTITVVPAQPLFANQSYSLTVSGVEDLAGNKANSPSFMSFTTGFAAGTTLSAIPSSATVVANPTSLFADGLQTTTILVSNVALSTGALAPNGTTIAVTADPAIRGDSAGGVILGGTPSPTDSRFKLFTTFGGGFSLTYLTPNLAETHPNTAGVIQLAGVDVAGTPARSSAGNLLIGSGHVTLLRGELVTSFFNPGNPSAVPLRANGTSVADVILTLFKGNVPAPASARLALTVDSVFATSAGGTINGGITASDPRFKIFTTLPDGTIEFSYTAPLLSSGTANAVFQAAAVDESGIILRQISFQSNQQFLSLSATSGSLSPQPVVVALSPAHSQSGVGTNARIVAKFSQPLDPATVSAATFSTTIGFVAINGTRTVSASERGPNTLVTFVPSVPLPANSSVVVAITSGITNSLGEPLLLNSLSSAIFSTGAGADTTAPSIVQVNPPNGVLTAGTNNVVTVEFSEPINATTVTTSTFGLTAGGVPVNGRINVVTGPRGPNTQAIFTPDQLLGGTLTYAVAVGTGITDTAGNPLAAPFTSSFGTGTGIDNFQPSLVSVSPQNQMTGLPLNTRVTARFSEPINPLTITATTFGLSLSPFGQDVSGTRTIASDLLSVTFTPTQLLLPNTIYSVLVQTNGTDVIRDLAGNALLTPGFSVGLGSFTTGSGPADTTGPHVILVSPADQRTAVPLNSLVVMQFSEPVSAPSLTAQSITISAGGIPLPGTLTLEQNNTMVRWTPASLTQLAANTVYTVTVGTSVTDLVGNPLSAPFTSTLTTGAGTDTVAPTVTSLTPLANETNVPRSAVIDLTFSEEIDPATIRPGSPFFSGTLSLTAGAETPGTVTFPLSDRRTLRFTPAFPLRAGQSYFLFVGEVEDLAGNKLTFSQGFTTAVAPGTNVSLLPTSAAVSATPAQLFADGQTTTTVTITNVVRSGILVPDGTVIGVTADQVFNNTSAGGTILGGVPSAADSRIRLFTTLNGSVTLTYQSPNRPDLFNGGTGIIQVSSVDGAGAPIGLLGTTSVPLVRGGFAVVDANPSSLLANGTSVSDVSVSVTDGSTPVPAGVTYAVTTEPIFNTTSFPGTLNGGTVAPDNRFKLYTTIPGGLLNFTYTAPLLAAGQNKNSVIQIAKVDGAGTLLSRLGGFFLPGENINLNGSTGSSSPQPVVITVSPANGQTTVGTTATIAAKFSLPLNRSTVVLSGPGASFTVTQGFVTVPGSLAFSASDRGPDTMVTFTPAAPFSINSSVSVNITAGIKSVSGEPLRAASSATFSIGLVADAVAPTVTQANPINGSGAVPTNSFVSAEFSEPINATTIDGATFAVTAGGNPVAGRFTFADGVRGKNSIVTFIPNQLLAPNTTYVLSITNGVKDSSGNGVIPATQTFTTTGGPDNIVPTVLSSIPTSGATGFPATGTPVTITLSEPVNPLTVHVNTVTGLGSAASPATVMLSANNTVITVTPSQPLFAGTQYSVTFQGIQDVAGNPLVSASVTFTTVLAPGTVNLPTIATVTANPPQVFANGLTTSQMTISNILQGSTLVPNGTLIAVTAAPAFYPSLGGTISGASVGTSVDGRFLLFSTFGAQVVVTYTAPNLGLQDSGASGQVYVQVAAIDLDTRPVSLIGTGNVSLLGASGASGSSTPTSLVANGTSTAALTVTVLDGASNPVPDGTRIGITAASVFSTSAGGTILGGTTSSVDPRIQVFTTVSGQITATYRAGTSPGTAVIQGVSVDGNGLALRNLGQFFISLQ